ncbi:hypothetical protein HGO21_16635 [Acinetobacter sp. CUI P1]|nr:hypothetical protein [Acinetobacter sp. CUI P1]
MTQDQRTQMDIFDFAPEIKPVGLEKPQVPAKTTTKPIKPAKAVQQDKSESFEVNAETRIKYDGTLTPITEYFSATEISEGIIDKDGEEGKLRKITGNDLRLRMMDECGEMSEEEYCTMVLFKGPNLVVPTIHAKKRGAVLTRFTGIYASLEEASKDGRRNMYIPSADGCVYHIRQSEFFSVSQKAKIVPDTRQIVEGVKITLPRKIDWSFLCRFISASKFFAETYHVELYGEIYWNYNSREYLLVFPQQVASLENVTPLEDDSIIPAIEEWVKVVEIHSHHYWEANPSKQDDESETASCLYVIVGTLNNLMPDITCRIHVDGKFFGVNPAEIFESPYDKKYSEDFSWLLKKVTIQDTPQKEEVL